MRAGHRRVSKRPTGVQAPAGSRRRRHGASVRQAVAGPGTENFRAGYPNAESGPARRRFAYASSGGIAKLIRDPGKHWIDGTGRGDRTCRQIVAGRIIQLSNNAIFRATEPCRAGGRAGQGFWRFPGEQPSACRMRNGAIKGSPRNSTCHLTSNAIRCTWIISR